jgi:hypothetical protein
MIGDIVAAAIGRKFDQRDGEGGTLGAFAGILGWKAAKKAIPAAIVIGAAYAALRYLNRKPDATTAAT